MPSQQGRYFIATISYANCNVDEEGVVGVRWLPAYLHSDNACVKWVLGQLEVGASGFKHYQLIFSVNKKMTIVGAKKLFPDFLSPHLELTRSEAAEAYVQKEDTRILDSQFEYGVNSIYRSY
jgi:Putative viral replication protein